MRLERMISISLRCVLFLILLGYSLFLVQGSTPALASSFSGKNHSQNFPESHVYQAKSYLIRAHHSVVIEGNLVQAKGDIDFGSTLAAINGASDTLFEAQERMKSLTVSASGMTLTFGAVKENTEGMVVQEVTVMPPASWYSQPLTQDILVEVNAAGVTTQGELLLPDLLIGGSTHSRVTGLRGVLVKTADGLAINLLTAQLKPGLAQEQATVPINGILDNAGNFSAELAALDTSIAGVRLTLNQIRVTNTAIAAQDGYFTLPERLGSWRSDRIKGVVVDSAGLHVNEGQPIPFTGVMMAIGSTGGYPMRSVSATVQPDIRDRLYTIRLDGEVLVSIPGDATVTHGWMDLYENGVIVSYVDKTNLPRDIAGFALKAEVEDDAMSSDGGIIKLKSATLTAPQSAGGLSITLNNVVYRAPGKDGCPQRPVGCLSISGGKFKLPELDLGAIKLSFEGGLEEEDEAYIISGSGFLKIGELEAEGKTKTGLPCTGITVSGEIAASRNTEKMIVSLDQDYRISQTMAYGPAVSSEATSEEQMMNGGVSLRKGALSLDCDIPIPKTAHSISSISGSIELNSGMVSVADVERQRRRDLGNVWMQSWTQPTVMQVAAAEPQIAVNQPPTCAINQLSATYNSQYRAGIDNRLVSKVEYRCEATRDGFEYNLSNNNYLRAATMREGRIAATWEGRFELQGGSFKFQFASAPGTSAELYVNGTRVQNDQMLTLPMGQHTIRVVYSAAGQSPSIKVSWQRQLPTVPTCPKNQFLAQYFNNKELAGTPVSSRCEREIRYNWEFTSPIEGIVSEDNFSVRWTGQFDNLYGRYQFIANIDEGIRVYAGNNSRPIIDSWKYQGLTEHRGTATFERGKEYEIRVEYFEGGGAASASVGWRLMTTSVRLNLRIGIESDVEVPLAGPVLVGTGDASLGINPFDLGIDLSAKLFDRIELERRYFRIYEEPTWGLKGGTTVNRPFNYPLPYRYQGELNAWLEPSTLACVPIYDPTTGGFTQTACFEKRTLLDRFFLTVKGEFSIGAMKMASIYDGPLFFDLPPFIDIPGVVGGGEGGRFNSRLWGLKLYVDWYRSIPRIWHWVLDGARGLGINIGQMGAYVDQTGKFEVSTDVSKYQLATPPRVAAARELWRQQQAGTIAANATGAEYTFTNSGDVEIEIGDKLERTGRVNLVLTNGDAYNRLQIVTPEGEVVTNANIADFAGRIDYLTDQDVSVPDTITETITNTTRSEMFAIRIVQPGEKWSARLVSLPDTQDYELLMDVLPAIPVVERFTVDTQEGESAPEAVIGWQITGTMPVSVTLYATLQDYSEEAPSSYLQEVSSSGDTNVWLSTFITATTRTFELGDFSAMADGNYVTATVSLEHFETSFYNFYIDVKAAGDFDEVVTATSEDVVWVSQNLTWPLLWAPVITPTVAFKTLELEWEMLDHPEVSGYVVYLADQSGLANPRNALYEFDNGNANKVVYGGLRAGKTYYVAVGVYRTDGMPLLLSPEIAVGIPIAPYSIAVDSLSLTVAAGSEARTQITVRTDLAKYPEAVVFYSGCFGPQSFGSRYLYLPLVADSESVGAPGSTARLCEPADGFQLDLGRGQLETPYVVPTQEGVVLTLDVIVPASVKPGRYEVPVDTWGGGQNLFFILQVEVIASNSAAFQQ